MPQDGRIELVARRPADRPARLDACPRCTASRACMRVLDRSVVSLDLENIGLRDDDRRALRGAARTGRTASCSSRARPARARRPRSTPASTRSTTSTTKIITVEDPIEYDLDGVVQIQVNEEIERHLRARAAHDPAPGPRHHPGGRDPRPRDGADRRRGRAHRPPGVLDPAHERRAVGGHAPDRHRHRAVPDRRRRSRPSSRSASCARSAAHCRTDYAPVGRGAARARTDGARTSRAGASPTARAARRATSRATRAAARSSRSWS